MTLYLNLTASIQYFRGVLYCEMPNAPGERRPTGTEPGMGTEPTLWAVRSTGLLGLGGRIASPAPMLLVTAAQAVHVSQRSRAQAWWAAHCPSQAALGLPRGISQPRREKR